MSSRSQKTGTDPGQPDRRARSNISPMLTDHEQKLLLRALDTASASAEAEKAAQALIASLRKRAINGFDLLDQLGQPAQTKTRPRPDTTWQKRNYYAERAEARRQSSPEDAQQWQRAREAARGYWQEQYAQQQAQQQQYAQEQTNGALSWGQTLCVLTAGIFIVIIASAISALHLIWLPVLLLIAIVYAATTIAGKDKGHFWTHLLLGTGSILLILSLLWGISTH